ncbi:ribonuclease H-like domain-containing protein [Tanacetum coccineum]
MLLSQPILSTSTTSSSPQVLLASSQPWIQDNRNNRDRDARNENKTEICRNFGRGYCRWGTNCRFIHASPKGTNNPRPNSSQHNTRSMQQGPGHTGLNSASQQHLLSLIQAQQNLLAQYGLSISQGQQPVQHNNTMGLRPNAPPGFQQTQPHQPTFGFNGHQQALYSAAVQNQSASSGSTSQETQLPHAFNTLTLQDPANSNWNMDTGASSHLNSSVNNLSTIFNSRIYPSVLVGDGKSIPVTNTGHSTLPTPYRTLHLNNVLITPNIVKNLISVRQFVRENKCTIEFDEFGFSVTCLRASVDRSAFTELHLLYLSNNNDSLSSVAKGGFINPHAAVNHCLLVYLSKIQHPPRSVSLELTRNHASDCTSLREATGLSKEPFRSRYNNFRNCPKLLKNDTIDIEGCISKIECLDSSITSQGFIHQLSAFLGGIAAEWSLGRMNYAMDIEGWEEAKNFVTFCFEGNDEEVEVKEFGVAGGGGRLAADGGGGGLGGNGGC